MSRTQAWSSRLALIFYSGRRTPESTLPETALPESSMLHRHPQGWQRAAEFAPALRCSLRRGHVIHREKPSRSRPVTRSEYECRETRMRYSERASCGLVRTAMVSASRAERARQTDVEGSYFNAGASSVLPCPPSRVCSGFSRPTLRVIKSGHCRPQSLTNPPPALNTCASLTAPLLVAHQPILLLLGLSTPPS